MTLRQVDYDPFGSSGGTDTARLKPIDYDPFVPPPPAHPPMPPERPAGLGENVPAAAGTPVPPTRMDALGENGGIQPDQTAQPGVQDMPDTTGGTPTIPQPFKMPVGQPQQAGEGGPDMPGLLHPMAPAMSDERTFAKDLPDITPPSQPPPGGLADAANATAFGRGMTRSMLGDNAEDLGWALDAFSEATGDKHAKTYGEYLREHGGNLKKDLAPETQWKDVHGVGQALTYGGEWLGSLFGGAAVPLAGGAAGAAVGGAPGGFVGAAAALEAPTIGRAYKDILSDDGVTRKIAAGTMTKADAAKAAAVTGTVMSAIGAIPIGKGLEGAALEKMISGAAAKIIAKEGFQFGAASFASQLVDEVSQATLGGDLNLKQRLTNSVQAGLSGLAAGGIFGAAKVATAGKPAAAPEVEQPQPQAQAGAQPGAGPDVGPDYGSAAGQREDVGGGGPQPGTGGAGGAGPQPGAQTGQKSQGQKGGGKAKEPPTNWEEHDPGVSEDDGQAWKDLSPEERSIMDVSGLAGDFRTRARFYDGADGRLKDILKRQLDLAKEQGMRAGRQAWAQGKRPTPAGAQEQAQAGPEQPEQPQQEQKQQEQPQPEQPQQEQAQAQQEQPQPEQPTQEQPQPASEAAPKPQEPLEPDVGTRNAPATADTLEAARDKVEPQPSPAQKLAGNYEKGHVNYEGLPISIETQAGGTRSGVGPDGAPWLTKMPIDYGYIKGSKGRDGDHIDAYIAGPPTGKAFVIDQVDPQTGKFDEHKVVLGANDSREAQLAYLSTFSDNSGAQRIGGVTEMSTPELKSWAQDKPQVEPVSAPQKSPKPSRPTPYKPQSLVQFLKSKGGIQDMSGELKSRNFVRRHPGLVNNKSGMTLDFATRVATDHGFLPQDMNSGRTGGHDNGIQHQNSIDDLLSHLDRHPTYSYDREAVAMREEAQRQEQERNAAERDFGDAMHDMGLSEKTLSKKDYEAALDAIMMGTDPVLAVERAIIHGVDEAPEAPAGAMVPEEHWNEGPQASGAAQKGGGGGGESAGNAPGPGQGGHAEASPRPEKAGPLQGKEKPVERAKAYEHHNKIALSGNPNHHVTVEVIRRPDGTFAAAGNYGLAGLGKSSPPSGKFNELHEAVDATTLKLNHDLTEVLKNPQLDRVTRKQAARGLDWLEKNYPESNPTGQASMRKEAHQVAKTWRELGFPERADRLDAMVAANHPIKASTLDADLEEQLKFRQNKEAAKPQTTPEEFTKRNLPPPGSFVVFDRATGYLNAGEVYRVEYDTPHDIDFVDRRGNRTSLTGPQAQTSQWRLAPSEEKGAEGKPQTVIPGAERASEKTMAQRKAEAPLRPSAEQKDVDGLSLFNDSSKQGSLLRPRFGEGMPKVLVQKHITSTLPEDRSVNLLNHAQRTILINAIERIFNEVVPPQVKQEYFRRLTSRDPNAIFATTGGAGGGVIEAGGLYHPAMRVLKLSTALHGKELMATALHEGSHDIWFHVLTDAERKLFIKDRFKIMKAFQGAHGWTEDQVRLMPPHETFAYAAEVAIGSRMFPQEGKNAGLWGRLSAGAKRLFSRFLRMLNRVRNWLDGLGFKSWEDVYDAMTPKGPGQESEMRQRAAGGSINDQGTQRTMLPRSEMDPRYGTAGGAEVASVRRNLKRTLTPQGREQLADAYKRSQIDFNFPLEKLQDRAEQATGATAGYDFRTSKRLLGGKINTDNGRMEKEIVEPLVKHAQKTGLSAQDLSDWFYAKHAFEVNALMDRRNARNPQWTLTGRGSGISDQEATRLMDDLRAQGKQAALQKAETYVKALRDLENYMLLSGGLISKEQYDQRYQMYPDYVPLKYWEDEDLFPDNGYFGARGKISGANIRGKESEIQAGRGTKAGNTVAALIDQTYRAIERHHINLTLNRMYDALDAMRRDPNTGQIDPAATKALGDTVRLDKGPTRKEIDQNTGFIKFLDSPPPGWSPNTISMKRPGANGTAMIASHMWFQDDVHGDAVRRMAPEQLRGLLKGFENLQQIAKNLWTHAIPDFIFRHFFMRYPLEGALNASEHGFKAAVKAFTQSYPLVSKAHRAALAAAKMNPAERQAIRNKVLNGTASESERWMNAYHELADNGGLMNRHFWQSFEAQHSNLERDLSKWRRVNPMTAWRAYDRFVGRITQGMDDAQRIVAYKQARDRGLSPEEATVAARDATIDFAMQGVDSRMAEALLVFAPTAQKTGYRAVQTAKRSPKAFIKSAAAMIGAGFALSLWNYLMAGTDDDGKPFWDKVPDYDKRMNMMIYLGQHDEHGRPIFQKFALPYLPTGLLTHSLGDTLAVGAAKAWGMTKEKIVHPIERNLHTLLEGFAPLGQESSLLAQSFPTYLRPVIHVLGNENYYGAPVHNPNADKFKPKSSQPQRNTPAWWKWAARELNQVSGGDQYRKGSLDFFPEDIRESIGWATDSVERFLTRSYNSANKALHGEVPNPGDVPIAQTTAAGGRTLTQKDSGDYYGHRDASLQAYQALRNAAKAGDKGAMADIREKQAKDLEFLRAFRSVDGKRARIFKKIEVVDKDPNLSRLDKDKMIDNLRQVDYRRMRMMNQAWDAETPAERTDWLKKAAQ